MSTVDPLDPSSVDLAVGFLLSMLEPPGLPRSFTDGPVRHTYDSALVVCALLGAGRVAEARGVGDALLSAQEPDGRVRSWFEPGAGQAVVGGASFVGSLAWVGLSLVRLYVRIRDHSYLDGAKRAAGWVLAHTLDGRGAGGFTGGLDAEERRLAWKATEHNLDLVALFSALATATGDDRWQGPAEHARRFALAMRRRSGYVTGTDLDGVTLVESPVPVDVQTWSYLALGDPGGLDHAVAAFATVDNGYTGVMAESGDPGPVWFEGTAHLALALNRHRPGRGDGYLASLRRAQAPDGGLPATSRDGPRHTGATAWYLLAALAHNPLDPGSPEARPAPGVLPRRPLGIGRGECLPRARPEWWPQ